MPQHSQCQICDHTDWEVIASRTFLKSDADSADDFTKGIYEFMFETWFPNQSEISFENLYCKNCGFIRHWPRPTEAEMDRLRNRNVDSIIGCNPKTDIEMAARRSRILFNYLNKKIGLNKTQKVLDYGGGDGNLLREFLDKNINCSLVDYSPYHIAGVNKIGNTVYDIEAGDKYDLIICSHVIEHVTDPKKVVKALLGHLSDGGVLFIEVPMEIWKYPPLLRQPNPITHLNFFSPNSLRNLITTSGGYVQSCHLMEYLYISSSWNPGLRCLARADGCRPEGIVLLKPDSMELLKPKLRTYFKYYSANPKRLRSEIFKRIKL